MDLSLPDLFQYSSDEDNFKEFDLTELIKSGKVIEGRSTDKMPTNVLKYQIRSQKQSPKNSSPEFIMTNTEEKSREASQVGQVVLGLCKNY